jgi:hypothetical protein
MDGFNFGVTAAPRVVAPRGAAGGAGAKPFAFPTGVDAAPSVAAPSRAAPFVFGPVGGGGLPSTNMARTVFLSPALWTAASVQRISQQFDVIVHRNPVGDVVVLSGAESAVQLAEDFLKVLVPPLLHAGSLWACRRVTCGFCGVGRSDKPNACSRVGAFVWAIAHTARR